MNEEQRRRMAYRTFFEQSEDGAEIEYTVRVSGQVVEMVRSQEMPWDNESGTGSDVEVDTWSMGLNTLKKLIASAKICIDQSEAFEAKKEGAK